MKTLQHLEITLIVLATLNLTQAQQVVLSPAEQTCSLGATATFQAQVSGGRSPYTFVFSHNDAPIDPPVHASRPIATLTLTNVSLLDAGQYKAVVTDANGTTTSNPAELRVDTTFTRITEGPLVTDLHATGGATWGDYDNDGRLDLFVANSGDTVRNSLYRNLGGDEFEKVTNALTLAPPGNSWGAQWADVDNDGDLDLFLLRPFARSGYPENQVRNEFFRNEGGGVFSPMTNAATAVAGFWTDATWVDHDGDGWLDLFATTQSMTAEQSLDDYFWRNLGDGRFAAWTTSDVGVVVKPNAKTAGPAWCDIDGDGDLDLYVSNYTGAPNFLYRNDGGLMVPVTAGSLPARPSTWGAAWADFNNDGLFDLFTGGENGVTALHLNRGNWVFEDVTAASGVELSGSVYGGAVGDFDNDGDLDLHVPVYDAADVLYVNRGDGTFDRADVGSPLTEGVNNGAMWVDYNNDGFLDLFEVCGDGTPALNLLYRNSLPQYGNTNHWLKLRLKGTASNASAIGARVWAKAIIGGKEIWQVRQLNGGCLTQVSPDSLWIHFGLRDAETVDLVRIEWPSGNVQELTNVGADQQLEVTEPVKITPARPSVSLNGSVALTLIRGAGVGTYQWQFNGEDLPGETARVLNLTNVVADQEGRYSLVVSNATTVTTNFVYVAVDTTFTKITEGAPATDVEGSGAAIWIDYDVDGDVDLFVANGSDAFNSLYQNNGDGTFTKISNPLTTARGNSWGIGWGDYDNDGLPDLIVAHPRNIPDEMFHNDGAGQFARITQGPLVTDTLDSIMPVWGDYDGDGFIDLFLATGYYSGPQPDRLYHNERDGSFRVTTANEVGDLVANPTLATAYGWSDFDNDGDPDLFVVTASSTSGPWTNFVFRNTPGAPFERVALPAFDRSGTAYGVAWGDYDNDGYLDVFKPGWVGTNGLMKNLQGMGFEDVSQASGLRLAMASEASAWADYDNDGWLDLFVGNYQGQPGYPGGNAVFRNNQNGTFTRTAMGSMSQEGGHCMTVACGDYDNDGFVDVYFACGDGLLEKNPFYRNNGNGNHWLKVRLDGRTSNRLGIGAKVRVQAQIGGRSIWQMREITGQHSWIGDNGLIAHFGLGDATTIATLRIEWPSGTVQDIANVAADQSLTITEPRRPALAVATIAPVGVTGTITGDPNTSYEINVSGEVATGWTLLTTVTTDANGTADWADPGPAPQGRRFYRASKGL